MIEVEFNDEDARAALGRLAHALTDMSPAMGEIADHLRDSTEDRFGEGKAPEGTPWAPKAASTIAAYLARGEKADPRPLFGPSGMLHSQIHSASGDDWAEVGSNRVYAAVMQFGAQKGAFGARMGRTKPTAKRPQPRDYFFHIPWGNIPARPFIGLSTADRTAIDAIVTEWLERAANGTA